MSWFNRRPRIKEHHKQTPHHTSPTTERELEKTKKKVRVPENPETKRNK